MTVLSVIFGILLAICGVICMVTPVATTFSLMYIYLVLLLSIGIIMLIKCIGYKMYGIEFIFSILSIIAGIFVFFSPNATFITEMILLYIMAGWLIFRGVVGLVTAAQAKSLTGNAVFTLAIIISVITILVGIYSFIHPLVFSGFLGVLAGVYFIVEGMDLIVFSFTSNEGNDNN